MADLENLANLSIANGTYELLERIHVSDMSVLYRAYNWRTKAYVAVKILKEERYLDRFKLEARSTYDLSRSNIAITLDFNVEGEKLPDGTTIYFLVFKWIGTKTLKDVVMAQRTNPPPTQSVLADVSRLLNSLAPALDYLHGTCKLAHRDVKPGNILFHEDDNQPYLIDFGIAKDISTPDQPENLDSITKMGMRPGTPRYMSPEQCRYMAVEGATDQYSLAVTLYEYISGDISPYMNDVGSNVTMTGQSRRRTWYDVHMNSAVTPLSSFPHRKDLPLAVDEVLAKGMAKNPESRYANVTEFARAFNAAAQSETTAATGTTGSEAARPKPATEGASKSPISGALVGVVVAIVVIVVAGILFISGQNQGGGAETATEEMIAMSSPTVEVEATDDPPTDEPTETAAPTDTEAPSATPSRTPQPTRTASPTVTRTPRPTATATEDETTALAMAALTENAPCMVQTDDANVGLYTEPAGTILITFLDPDTPYEVLESNADFDEDEVWWRLDPDMLSAEFDADEIWVNRADVESSGNCEEVEVREVPTAAPTQAIVATVAPTQAQPVNTQAAPAVAPTADTGEVPEVLDCDIRTENCLPGG
jgi:serine/threonine protein kinase